MPRNRGKAWKTLVTYVILRDAGICHLCGHHGATSGDHVIPYLDAPHLELEPSNVRAAHWWPCPVCRKRCNMVKGARRTTSVLPTLHTSRRWT